MCGICGFNGEDKELLRKMTSLLSHRGPDGDGFYSDGTVSLGHRRLSIIDLSASGKQPMSNEDGTIWITFNGEVYNFQELRKELEKRGHTFSSNTDTEAIIHGYEEWGETVVQRLNGMFAFAIWDTSKKTLFIARDRLGVKPLYYYWNGEKFIFASEIKSILADTDVPRKLNQKSLRHYLNLRYIPGNETLFEAISVLLPGHTLTLQGKDLQLKQYWDLPAQQNGYIGTAAEIRQRLEESVRKRLIADVPIGIYLSGGIDSAAITALASKIKKEEAVKTFSVGFDHSNKVDELTKARIIAKHCNTDHKEIVVKGSVAELLPKLLWHLDQPHGDPVIIPQFHLSQKAREKVTVVLSGEGADEIFGGYVQYKTMLTAQKIKIIPSLLTKTAAQLVPIKVLDKLFDYPVSIGEKGKEKLVDFLGHINDEEKAYQDLISIMSDKDRKKLLLLGSGRSTKEDKQEKSPYFQQQRQPLLNRMMYYDTKTWLPNYVLFINDRMTMANAIEGRTPFLDYTFVEHVHHLHHKQKFNFQQNKIILREAMKPLLPKTVAEGKKHAFFTPLDRWYKEELKGLAEQLFTPSSVRQRGLYDYDYLKEIWGKYPRSPLVYGKQLFTVINLELWQRQFLDQDKLKPMVLKQLLG